MGYGTGDNAGLTDRIAQVAQPLCDAENFELVHVECVISGREKIVRLYLDKPGGITLDDCVAVSRQLGDLIDVQIEDLGSYRLEVSSPGPHRPLTKKEDFHRFAGKKIRLETHDPIEGQRRFTGILEKVSDTSIVINVDGYSVEISDLQISKAALAGD